MSRVRADDYEDKMQAILDAAAALFAKTGYPSAKMQDIATACGATKSMLYHYFPTKDDLLFAMLDQHLQSVLKAVEQVMGERGTAVQRLSSFVLAYAQKSAQSRRRHIIAMNDVKYLPADRQAPLLAMEVKIIDLVAALLHEVHPGLSKDFYTPYTMMLIGMLNWTDTWYRPGGKIKPQDLCERMARLFLHGFLAEATAPAGAALPS
ncbi:MAG: TetR/AcrR family transcriptional regulator [Burkholderiales bacterium]